jgi:hypothetical protein
MRREHQWRIGAVIALGFLASLALSDQATARPFEAGFSVNTSNGYRISVAGWHHAVRVLVTQGPVRIGRHVVETEYFGRGIASPAGIEADLGSLGSISMQFTPSAKGEIRTSPKNCSPHRVYRRPGTFNGNFRFLGEASYAAFEAAEVKGSIGTPDDLICGTFSTPIEGRPPLMPYLGARTSNHYLADGFLAFGVRRGADPRRTYFTAESREHVEGLSVSRFVTEMAPASSFAVGPHLRTATVTPPAPFSGTAIFESRRTLPSWSGSLSVSFPGKVGVPLTGPNFKLLELGQSRYP